MTTPTDDQIDELEKEMWFSTGVVEWGQRENIFNYRKFVREALNRWGTPEPIALEDREPHHTDLDDCGSCWWWDEVDECYDSLCGDMGGVHRIREVNKLNDYPHHYTHWLPHWAIKYPQEKEND